VLTRLRHTLQTKASNRLVARCSTRYPHGFVTHVPQGDVPSREESVARYLAQEVVSPPIALRRLAGDDGHRVPSHSHAHPSERVERETGEVSTLRGRMMPHVFAKGCTRLRSYGGQATKTFAKITGRMREALSKITGGVRGAVTIMARLTYRQREHQSSGRDPCRLRRRNYSRPLASELDVKVSLHPAQASQRPCDRPVSGGATRWLHDTRRKSMPSSAP